MHDREDIRDILTCIYRRHIAMFILSHTQVFLHPHSKTFYITRILTFIQSLASVQSEAAIHCQSILTSHTQCCHPATPL